MRKALYIEAFRVALAKDCPADKTAQQTRLPKESENKIAQGEWEQDCLGRVRTRLPSSEEWRSHNWRSFQGEGGGLFKSLKAVKNCILKNKRDEEEKRAPLWGANIKKIWQFDLIVWLN